MPSSGGSRALVISTQERALSVDINRLQKFIVRDEMEAERLELDAYGNDDVDAGSVVTEPNTIETPLRVEILNGLLVRPQAGSLNLLVDPGVAYVMAPNGIPDESNYKYVRDAGVPGAGTLLMTANASGLIRIDVVECQINPIESVVTDSRDIFDLATGLFSATVVTKEAAAQLTYRVRAGTPGAGFPANVPGWRPLAVVHVPNGSVNVNTMTFWDVRPLITDRANGPFNLTRDMPVILDAELTIDAVTAFGVATPAYGWVDAIDRNGRRVGGRILKGSPGTDGTLDLQATDNVSGAIGITSLAYLYLVTPFGLPRWARYAAFPSARVPKSPRGLPLLTAVAPQHFRGVPSAGIAMPASWGFGAGASTDAVCIAIVPTSGIGNLVGGILEGRTMNVGQFAGVTGANLEAIAATSVSVVDALWTLTPGTHFPANAKAIHVKFTLNFPGIPGNSYVVLDPVRAYVTTTAAGVLGPAKTYMDGLQGVNTVAGLDAIFYLAAGKLTIPSTVYPAVSDGNRRVILNWTNATPFAPAATMTIVGWDL